LIETRELSNGANGLAKSGMPNLSFWLKDNFSIIKRLKDNFSLIAINMAKSGKKRGKYGKYMAILEIWKIYGRGVKNMANAI